MQATAESRTAGRRGPGNGPGLHAVDHGPSTNGVRKPPPHDPVAERSLIGAMLIPQDGSRAIEVAMAALVPDDFYDPANANVAAAIFALTVKGTMVDAVTVADQLRRDGLWVDELASEFMSMVAGVPAIGNAGEYADIVKDCSRRRRMRATAAVIDHAAQEGDEAGLERALATIHDIHAGGRPELVVEDLGAVIRGEEPEIVPTMLYRSDGKALLYPGLLHWVMGEPGCGKTWMAILAELAAAQSGIAGLYLDYEGSRRIVGARLARLGATEDDVAWISYVRPSGGSSTTGPGALRLVRDRAVGLVVIDGAAKSMAREGIDEDKAPQVLGWMERLIWPLCDAGATVVVLDHVPKDKDARGRWARGSGAKLGEVDGAAFNVKVAKGWSRSTAGYATVDVAKDREGVIGAVDETAALLKFAPVAGGGLNLTVAVPSGTEVTNTIHAAVERAVSECGDLTQIRLENEVRQHGKWSHDTIRSAAESLATAGRILVRNGPRNSRIYSPLNAPEVQAQLHIVEPPQEDF